MQTQGLTIRRMALTGAIAAGLLAPLPAAAQSDAEVRLRKVEAEVRALQRRVFPGADGKYFEPEISGPAQSTSPAIGVPSTTALTDVLARLDALEGQLQRLTAANEENANTLRLLQDRVEGLEAARTVAPVSTTSSGSATAPPRGELPATSAGSSAAKPTSAKAATGPSPERLAAVQAVTKPDTGNAGEDEYTYGFRLWEAKLYPEAAQQLTSYVEKYPSHSMISYGRNLLGRAYLDDGKAREAAAWFLKNYQEDKNGARAGDSLLFLAESMVALKDTKRACIALAEFAETYPALATGRLQSQYAANRAKVTCN